MSKYTTEVRFICENFAGYNESKDYTSVDEIVENARKKIFNFNYPIFDENYRGIIERKILKHYYSREICCETVARWKLFLNTRMNEIMPYYNKLYESELLKFSPLNDVDVTTKRDVLTDGTRNDKGNRDTTNNSTTETTTNNDTDSWNYYSDTPQGGINGLSNNTYLTNATHDTDDFDGHVFTEDGFIGNEKTESDSTYKDSENYLEHVIGKRGGSSYSKLLKDFRETFLNIDMKIIDDLSDLFFNLW